MKNLDILRATFSIILPLIVANTVIAQNIGIGTDSPRVALHVVNGLQGKMGFPYETLVVEKSEDSKLGVYSTALSPLNLRASSIALGYTNYLDGNGNYPSYEMQYGVWDNAGLILRFNALGRRTNGTYLISGSYTNVLSLDTKGHVGINLTDGAALPPIQPTANLHVRGTVRFENLPAATSGGNFLVIDPYGNVQVSEASIAIRPADNATSGNTIKEIELLRTELRVLKERVLLLEKKFK